MKDGWGPLIRRWGIILVLVLVAVVVRLRFSGDAAITYDRILACSSCGHIWGASLDTDDTFPVKCPECGQMAGGFAYLCNNCSTVFAFIPAPSSMPICPKCRKTDCSRLTSLSASEE